MTAPKKMSRLAVLAAIPLLIAGLAACSPTSNTAGEKSPSASSGSSSQKTYDNYDDWYLAFAGCMREAGQDVPDKPDRSKSVEMTEAYQAASQKCQEKIGQAPGQSAAGPNTKDPGSGAGDGLLAVAKCFRDAGFDMPDPKPGEAGKIPEGAPANVIDKCLAGGR